MPLRAIVAALLSGASLSALSPQTFTGVISDSECGGSHTSMRMGETDAECVKACLDAHGATYVLSTSTRIYALSDQRTPQRFAGAKVTVTGMVDPSGKTLLVESIAAAR